MSILFDYLQWVKKTKKSANLSQLISHAIPKNAGEKATSRRKGGRSKKDLPLVPLSSFTEPGSSKELVNKSTYVPQPACTVSYTASNNTN